MPAGDGGVSGLSQESWRSGRGLHLMEERGNAELPGCGQSLETLWVQAWVCALQTALEWRGGRGTDLERAQENLGVRLLRSLQSL